MSVYCINSPATVEPTYYECLLKFEINFVLILLFASLMYIIYYLYVPNLTFSPALDNRACDELDHMYRVQKLSFFALVLQ